MTRCTRRWLPSSNESMAGKFFGSSVERARQRRFRNGWNEISGPTQIIGVVQRHEVHEPESGGRSDCVLPAVAVLPPMRWAHFVLRANGPAASLIPSVKAAVDEVKSRYRGCNSAPLLFRLTSRWAGTASGNALSGFFGALALGWPSSDCTASCRTNVARRRNEIGIRMALGAEQARVLRMI
jgi:hypothetical protein